MRVKSVLFWLGIVTTVAIVLLPLIWIYLSSFKSLHDIVNPSIKKLFFFAPTVANYKYLFCETPFFKEILNTAILSVSSTIMVMIIALPAAYSFARFNTGYGHLLFITISTRMFPPAVAAIPFFFLFRDLGLLDTHFGLFLLYVYFNVSFAIILLFGFFREIPEELEQAAMVDGYSRLAILRKIVFPLIKPGAAITSLFCLVFSWNEFLYAHLFTRSVAKTAAVGLTLFWGSLEIAWGPMAACIGLLILPTLFAAWFMQRYIIRGLTFGAVKG